MGYNEVAKDYHFETMTKIKIFARQKKETLEKLQKRVNKFLSKKDGVSINSLIVEGNLVLIVEYIYEEA